MSEWITLTKENFKIPLRIRIRNIIQAFALMAVAGGVFFLFMGDFDLSSYFNGSFFFLLAWDTLLASETDANSPLNQTLFDKIRGNINYLAGIAILFTDQSIDTDAAIAKNSWTTVKTGLIYVPTTVDTVQAKIIAGFTAAFGSKDARLRIANASTGWNAATFTPNGGGSTNWDTVTVPSSGSYDGPGGWREYQVQLYHNETLPKAGYVNALHVKILTVVA